MVVISGTNLLETCHSGDFIVPQGEYCDAQHHSQGSDDGHNPKQDFFQLFHGNSLK